MSRIRKAIFWATAVLLPILALLVAIEIGSYWSLPHWTFPLEDQRIIAYDPEIGFVARPHLRAKWGEFGPDGEPIRYHVYTDRRGARVARPGDEAPPHPDILFIGCSFTWGHGVESDDTFAARAAQGLNAAAANLALFAHGTTQAVQLLRRNRDLQPQLVVYSFITSHLQRNVSRCAPSYYPFCLDVSHVVEREDGRPEIAPPLSNGVRRLDLQLTRETTSLAPVAWAVHGVDVILGRISWRLSRVIQADQRKQEASLQYLLEQMAYTANELRAKLLVVHIPTGHEERAPATLLKSLDRLQLPFLDLSPTFRAYQENPQNPLLYTPNGHPSLAGHRVISEAIVSFVHQQILLRR